MSQRCKGALGSVTLDGGEAGEGVRSVVYKHFFIEGSILALVTVGVCSLDELNASIGCECFGRQDQRGVIITTQRLRQYV